MFKKLREIAEGRVDLLTVRTTEARLERNSMETILQVIIDGDMEVLTTSKERKEHFETASSWLKEQLKRWNHPKISRVEVATFEHPLEVVTGDVAPILVIEGKKYLVSFYRDILPTGWLIPGGCPRVREELIRPRPLAVRECSEEVLISDTKGRVYNFFPSSTELEENIQAWGLKPTELVSLLPKELLSPGGDARNLVIMDGDQERWTRDVKVVVDTQIASVSITLYWEITLPIKFEELKIFDGEKFPDKTLINRPVQLTDESGSRIAIFSRGQNILAAGWISEGEKERAIIP